MGNRLKEIRKNARLTQEALAEAIGSTRSQIVKLERGERRLSAPWLEKLAPVLKVSQGEILGDILPRPKPELALLGCLTGNGSIHPVPSPLNGQRMHLPVGIDTEDGLEAWVMGDNSMAREIKANTLLIVADPRKHFFPVVPGALLMFKKRDKVFLRQFIESTDGTAWLAVCPETPDPSLQDFRFNSGAPKYIRQTGTDCINIDDISGAVMWEHRSRLLS